LEGISVLIEIKNTKLRAGNMESIRDQVRIQANDLRVDGFLSFILTADIANRYVELALARHDMSRTDMNILHTLITHDGSMKPIDISRSVFRTPHTITSAIDKLEKKEYVRREITGQDRRIKLVSITNKGLDLVNQSMPRRQRLTSKAMSCLDQSEMEQLRSILKRLRKNLRAEINKLSRRNKILL
jgi:DNA-binding MarR family transcriptional regulator